MDFFTLVGLASLLLQFLVLALLVYGYYLKRKLRFKSHGLAMAAATFLHLALIFAIMVPSFVLALIPVYVALEPLTLVSLVGLMHAITGTIAVILGVWLVAVWRFRRDFSGCFKHKKAMWPTMILWLITLVLGIVLFYVFYGPSLMG